MCNNLLLVHWRDSSFRIGQVELWYIFALWFSQCSDLYPFCVVLAAIHPIWCLVISVRSFFTATNTFGIHAVKMGGGQHLYCACIYLIPCVCQSPDCILPRALHLSEHVFTSYPVFVRALTVSYFVPCVCQSPDCILPHALRLSEPWLHLTSCPVSVRALTVSYLVPCVCQSPDCILPRALRLSEPWLYLTSCPASVRALTVSYLVPCVCQSPDCILPRALRLSEPWLYLTSCPASVRALTVSYLVPCVCQSPNCLLHSSTLSGNGTEEAVVNVITNLQLSPRLVNLSTKMHTMNKLHN